MELTGQLQSRYGTVKVQYSKLNEKSSKRLLSVLKTGCITSDNQNLFFEDIVIDEEDLDVFLKGQNEGLVITTTAANPIHFSGEFELTDKVGTPYRMNIGNIVFNVKSDPSVSENIALFSNVPAVLYRGEYSIKEKP